MPGNMAFYDELYELLTILNTFIRGMKDDYRDNLSIMSRPEAIGDLTHLLDTLVDDVIDCVENNTTDNTILSLASIIERSNEIVGRAEGLDNHGNILFNASRIIHDCCNLLMDITRSRYDPWSRISN